MCGVSCIQSEWTLFRQVDRFDTIDERKDRKFRIARPNFVAVVVSNKFRSRVRQVRLVGKRFRQLEGATRRERSDPEGPDQIEYIISLLSKQLPSYFSLPLSQSINMKWSSRLPTGVTPICT